MRRNRWFAGLALGTLMACSSATPTAVVVNNEVIFPIVKGLGLKGVLFVDAGNAYSGLDALSYEATRFAAGGGVRWLSPLGPLRIELGFPFNEKPDDQTSLVLFSFGGPFQF